MPVIPRNGFSSFGNKSTKIVIGQGGRMVSEIKPLLAWKRQNLAPPPQRNGKMEL